MSKSVNIDQMSKQTVDIKRTGLNIRNLMFSRGMSCQDLASLIGCCRNEPWEWSSGRKIPNLKNCVKLSEIFDISIDKIVERKLENDIQNDD